MMKQSYTGIEQFDFQIIRFTALLKEKYPQVRQDLKEIGRAVKDTETWYQWWTEKAKMYEAEKLTEIAALYYRASFFYLEGADKRREEAYQQFRTCFYVYYQKENLKTYQIPYENGFLPAIYLKSPQAKETLVVFGGFDSYLEELTTWFLKLQEMLPAYHILIFDGPGQGHVPTQRIYFEASYERAVSRVLDYFDLQEVAALGVSWGGYFVMRAAAFEKRIKRLLAFDIFYSPMDTLRLSAGTVNYLALKMLLSLQQKSLVNRVIEKKAQHTIHFQWFLQNGYYVTGEDNPYDLIQNIRKHEVKSFLPLVNQDCLLMAGADDFYVPAKRLKTIERSLMNANRVETRLFSQERGGGSLHCQIDNIFLALQVIMDFLNREKQKA